MATLPVRHYKILAIRVDFQPDSISTTTGNGLFESGYPASASVDPLPHDRAYFEDHLSFLKNYFGEVSKGKISIDTFAVYPQQADSAYRLPNQMWHYNYNLGKEDLDKRLAELFQDSWKAAAADTGIDFTQWDTFVIFHAGTGQDFTVGFDETPHDIPSAYFTLDDLRQSLDDPTFPGIPAGNIFVTGGMLLPETERQFEVDVEIALNGTATLLFAQWIGLPALYDTETGASGVGRFDLMDQGSGNFAGMIPSRPCAWSRVFMGWEEPLLITPAAVEDTFKVNLTGRGTPTDTAQHEIYRLNLNESEYYLIENRSWDPDSLGYTYAYDRDGRKLKIKDDYTVEADSGFKVIVRVDNYDFGLPGEGILIWHVNDQVIYQNYASNTVNNDPEKRGVSLIEADGAPDIGKGYSFLDVGYGTEFGWAGDFFFAGNQQFLNANPQLLSHTVLFYDDSHPGTRSQDNSSTGLKIGGFSSIDSVMSFWVKSDWAQVGFPKKLAGEGSIYPPCPLDVNLDNRIDFLLVFSTNGAIQLFDTDGHSIGSVYSTRTDTSLMGEITTTQDTLLAKISGINSIPAVDQTDDGFIAFFTSNDEYAHSFQYTLSTGMVEHDSLSVPGLDNGTPLITQGGINNKWYATTENGIAAFQSGLNLIGQITVFDSIGTVSGMCLADTTVDAPIFIVYSSGQAALVTQDLQITWKINLPFNIPRYPLTLIHTLSDRIDLGVVSGSGNVILLDPATGVYRPGFPMSTGIDNPIAPIAADLDNDGRLELVLVGDNRIVAVQNNGVLAANWPMLIDASKTNTSIFGYPIISELGLTPELRVIFGWPDGSIDTRGELSSTAKGFPKTTAGTVLWSPIVVNMDDDPEAELVAVDDSGILYAWHLNQSGNFDDQRHPWNGYLNGNYRQSIAYDPVTVAAPDHSVLVKSKVYPWPNPATDVSHIRYKMGQSGKISVRIFDGSGDLVKELTGSSEAGIEGELHWNLDGVSSGVYIGRVEASAGGQKETAFIKIAVVK
ncbi:MAG: hypothetical protein NTW14_06800 [bacterium]|nr:hypothetical protein [bacterium]